MYGIFWWLSPLNIHIALRRAKDRGHCLLLLWVSLLPPWLCWEHWALAEWGAAAALSCGSWRAEATWCTLTCSKLSCKQEHFGLFWTVVGETIFFVQPWIRENMSEWSWATLLLTSAPNQLQLREHYKPSLTNIIHCFLHWWVVWGTCWRKNCACIDMSRVYYLQKATSTQKVTITCWTNRTFVADKINLEILTHRLHYLRRKENIWMYFEILLFQLTFLIASSFVLRTYL